MRAMRKLLIPRLHKRAPKHATYTSVITSAKTGKRVGKKRRRLANSVVALLIMSLIGIVTTSSAEAGFWSGACDLLSGGPADNVMLANGSAQQMMGGYGFLAAASSGDDQNTISMTAYEALGAGSGLLTAVSIDPDGCSLVDRANTAIANDTFQYTKTIIAITTFVISQATNSAAYQGMANSVTHIIVGDGAQKGIADLLYFDWLGIILTISALYFFWVGLIKKQSIRAAQDFVWMFCIMLFGALFMFNPGLIINGGTAITTTAANVMNNVGGTLVDKIANSQGPCATPNDNMKGTTISASADAATRTTLCKIDQTFKVEPWTLMQFGTANPEPMVVADPNTGDNISWSIPVGNRSVVSQPYYQLYATTASPFKDPAINANKQARFNVMVASVRYSHPSWERAWAGENGADRKSIALTSVITSLFACIFLIILGGKILISGFETLMYVLVAPVMLLMGVNPAMKGTALMWIQGLIKNLVTRAAQQLFLGFTLLLYSSTMNLPTENMAVKMLIVIVFVIMLMMFEKKFIAMLGIHLPGNNQGDLNFMGGGAGKVGGAATAAVAGFAGGLLKGKGFGGAATNAIKATSRTVAMGGNAKTGIMVGSRQGGPRTGNVAKQNAPASHRAKAEQSRLHESRMVSDSEYRDDYTERTEKAASAKNDLRVQSYGRNYDKHAASVAAGKPSNWAQEYSAERGGVVPPVPSSLPHGRSGYDWTRQDASIAAAKKSQAEAKTSAESAKVSERGAEKSAVDGARSKSVQEKSAATLRTSAEGLIKKSNESTAHTGHSSHRLPTQPLPAQSLPIGRPVKPVREGDK